MGRVGLNDMQKRHQSGRQSQEPEEKSLRRVELGDNTHPAERRSDADDERFPGRGMLLHPAAA